MIIYIVMICAVMVFSYLPFLAGFKSVGSLKMLPLYAWIVLFMMPILSIFFLSLIYLRSRPLGMDDGGIAIFLFGRRWKFIDWHSVKKVEKFRVYDSFFYEYRHVFLVSADGIRIRFDDWVGDLPGLIATLNGYIARYQIPTFAVDRGRDTLRKISSSTTDIATRKKLLNDGVRTTLTKL